MAEFVCKIADTQGRVQQMIESAETEDEIRQRFNDRGFLIYSVRPRRSIADITLKKPGSRAGRIHLEQFLIFNQQFLTLTKAGLPVMKSLDLLVGNVKNKKLAGHLRAVHNDVRSGTPLSAAFESQGVFPPIYNSSILAGERSGSLVEVIERYVSYQKVSLGIRKKIVVSLIYPCVLVVLVFVLIIFLVTYVVPEFASLYESLDAQLPYMTQVLVAFGTTISQNLLLIAGIVAAWIMLMGWWLRSNRVRDYLDRIKIKIPIFGTIWIKYQVSQLCRLLSTLLAGGIPLMQALETTGKSLGSRLLRDAITQSRKMVKEGSPLSVGMASTKVFPVLAIEMIQVGESTGALPAMLNSVAEFFDEDVNTHMTAALSLIEPAIMIFMGIFIAFVLIALYLPIFSLADSV
jgi:type IV pilus assembly protein PilC